MQVGIETEIKKINKTRSRYLKHQQARIYIAGNLSCHQNLLYSARYFNIICRGIAKTLRATPSLIYTRRIICSFCCFAFLGKNERPATTSSAPALQSRTPSYKQNIWTS
jgi:hypothetical protein